MIDKPLYYIPSLATGLKGEDLGLISCTRTFGHTALLLLLVTGIAMLRRSRILAALALGMAAHLVLDNLWDGLHQVGGSGAAERSALVALLFPFYKGRFSFQPFDGLGQHARSSFTALNAGAEAVGAAILGWDWWKNRHESEIIQLLRIRRHLRKDRRRRYRQA